MITMSNCQIHNVRFYKLEPRSIRCIALQHSTKVLAVSRSDASIEIWNLNYSWFIERTITSTTENFSVEGLAWCGNRLFSVGLHGLLIEYDLFKLSLKSRSAVTGEAAFCLDINEDKLRIAIGTEQGYLNIFKVEDDGVYFEKFLDKQEGRIICLKFDPTGEFVVSGSVDVIRIWNVQSGHAIHKMTTGRSEANKPTIVWCLEVANDFTIMSGDSRGKLTLWDGKIGSQLESYQSHKADVLALCFSEDQKSLYCAGVDPNIVNYVKISVKGDSEKWVRSIQRKIHEHDVNALTICDNKLYSGGADSYLACSFHPPKTLLKLPPLLQNPSVTLAPEARFMMLRYPKHVEVWSLGRSENADSSYRGFLNLKDEPKKLLALQRVSKDYEGEEGKEGIICSCISSDGKWIFFSTCLGVRLLQFVCVDEKPSLLKVDDLESEEVPCVQAVFTPDSSHLVTAPNSGGLLVYDIKDGKASINQTLDNTDLTDAVTFLTTSACSQYIIAGDPSSNVVIWTVKKKQWTKHCKLPKYQHPPTALAVHPRKLLLIVAYSDGKIVEYDIKKRHFTPFMRCLETSVSTQWKSRPYPIRNITFDPRADNIIILHDDSNIFIVNKEKKSEEKNTKMPKKDSKKSAIVKSVGQIKEEIGFHTIKKYKHLAHFSWLGEDEMVAVEVNPLTLIEQLPPAFVQNTFGRK